MYLPVSVTWLVWLPVWWFWTRRMSWSASSWWPLFGRHWRIWLRTKRTESFNLCLKWLYHQTKCKNNQHPVRLFTVRLKCNICSLDSCTGEWGSAVPWLTGAGAKRRDTAGVTVTVAHWWDAHDAAHGHKGFLICGETKKGRGRTYCRCVDTVFLLVDRSWQISFVSIF